ncbi:MAG: hypothetical protein WCD35_06815 [Mycobacteriales bacterium]
MNKRVASLVLVSAMGVGAVSTLALTPASAATQAVSQRLTDLKNALKGLVTDGTLTQAQADKVATTLDSALPEGGPGGRGGPDGHRRGAGLDEAATVLGMSVTDLRAALEGGKSLAQVAQSKGISKATLIDKLVAAANAHLAAEVKAGEHTQAEADARLADLKARITDMVDRVGLPMRGDRMGPPPAAAPGTGSTTTG